MGFLRAYSGQQQQRTETTLNALIFLSFVVRRYSVVCIRFSSTVIFYKVKMAFFVKCATKHVL